MSIFDWIESEEGPDVSDFQGVTRSDGDRVERGDRDDKPAKRKAVPYEYNEQESREKLRAKLDDMGARHKKALIESGYGQVPEGQKSGYREAHEASAKQSRSDAVAESKRRTSSPHSTPYGLELSTYVDTAQRFDFTPVLIVAFLMLGIFVALGG